MMPVSYISLSRAIGRLTCRRQGVNRIIVQVFLVFCRKKVNIESFDKISIPSGGKLRSLTVGTNDVG